MRAALLLAAPLLLAGCTGSDGSFGFAEGGDPLAPYFQEYHETIDGAHTKLFDVPVDAGARRLNVTVQLDSRTNGLPVPDATPATLDVRLLDPSGAAIREAKLDAQHPGASLVADDLAPGVYHVEIKGFGASQELNGAEYGAGYVASVEVLYSEA